MASTPDLSPKPAWTPPKTFPLLIASLWLGTFLVAIDGMIVSVAVPKITSEFGALNDVGWYGSAYLLCLTALQPSAGRVYREFDVKPCFLASVACFEVGSLLCALAPSSPIFILGRAIAGSGAAGVFQGVLGIISIIVPLPKRPLYYSIVFSVFGVATCMGPPVGGAFTTRVTWRWCFWINLPIGAVSFLLIWLFLKIDDVKKEKRSLLRKVQELDIPGALLLIAAISLLVLVLQYGGTSWAWNSPQVIGLLVGAGVLGILFICSQLRERETATIPPRLMRQRTIFMTSCYTFAVHASVYVVGYFLPFYFQAVEDTSATISGVRYMALAVPQTFITILIGVLVSKSGYYVPFMVLGSVIGAVGIGLLCTLGLQTSVVQWAVYLVLAGLGTGIVLQLPPIAVQAVSSNDDLPTSNAIALFFAQLGGTLAVPIADTIFVTTITNRVSETVPSLDPRAIINAGATGLHSLTNDPAIYEALQEAYADGVQSTMYLAVAFIAISAIFGCGEEWRNLKTDQAPVSSDNYTAVDKNSQTTEAKRSNAAAASEA